MRMTGDEIGIKYAPLVDAGDCGPQGDLPPQR